MNEEMNEEMNEKMNEEMNEEEEELAERKKREKQLEAKAMNELNEKSEWRQRDIQALREQVQNHPGACASECAALPMMKGARRSSSCMLSAQ